MDTARLYTILEEALEVIPSQEASMTSLRMLMHQASRGSCQRRPMGGRTPSGISL